MKRPNTFIIGAPKCGTTALCHYLQNHPEVFMCTPKEPHYFAHKDMPNRQQYFRELNSYLDLFSEAEDNHKILSEGSVWYLYCINAVKEIAKFNPDAKLIVMLRRPDEMVYSFHSQALVNYDEDVLDFSAAWKMALNPESRGKLPKYCHEPTVLMYDRIARYHEQLERVYRHFPKNQVHIIFYEDFSTNTADTFLAALNFLGIGSIEKTSFERVNENSVIKNRFLGRYIEHPPKFLISILNILKRLIGRDKLGIKDKLLKINSKTATRPKINEDVRKEVIDTYRRDIRSLESLTNRDLSHWLE